MNNYQLTTILQQIDPNIYTISYDRKVYIYTLDKENHTLSLGSYNQQANTLHLRDEHTNLNYPNLININDPHFISKFTNWLNKFNKP